MPFRPSSARAVRVSPPVRVRSPARIARLPLSRVIAPSIVAVAALTIGCSPAETAADRHFAEMREAVAKLQADGDRTDQRLGALEVAVADEKSPRPATSAATGPLAPPVPRVVQLGGAESGDETSETTDASARPDIRVVGASGVRGASANRARSSSSSGARESESFRLRSEFPRGGALDPEAKRSYEAALAQVQAKHYDRGLEGLNAFLVRWPDHPYAENAMYWRGEAYFAQGEYLRAGEQFEAALARFANGNKTPDALLKLGMCQDRLGASAHARESWDRLKSDYPRSDAAKKIPAGGRDATSTPRADSSSGSGAREDGLPKGPRENR